jgi:NADH-quinone oxidoreductase subunit F
MNPPNKTPARPGFEKIRREAETRRRAFNEAPGPKIHIGMASCGIASGALATKDAFEQALAQRGIEARIHTVGCIGHCYAEPYVIIDHPQSGFPPVFYAEVSPGKARMLTNLFLAEGDPRFEHVLVASIRKTFTITSPKTAMPPWSKCSSGRLKISFSKSGPPA